MAPLRLPPSTSVLVALSSLTLPSPILSASQLSITSSTGDIPILIDFDIAANDDEDAISLPPSLLPLSGSFPSQSIVCLVELEAPLDLPHHRSSSLNIAESFERVAAFSRDGFATEASWKTFDSHNRTNLDTPPHFKLLPSSIPRTPAVVHSYTPPDKAFVISKVQTSNPDEPGDEIRGFRYVSLTKRTTIHLPEADADVAQPNSPPFLSSTVSHPGVCEDAAFASVASTSPSIIGDCHKPAPATVGTDNLSPPSRSDPRNVLRRPNIKERTSIPQVTETLSVQIASQQGGTLTTQLLESKGLRWLEGIKIELLIDQEGFRTANPSFEVMGLFNRNGTELDMVQFRPTTRQKFHFHYAPFDSAPILRRITVNGDESRDYISRQASLSLKSNGVYTVRGTEHSSLPDSEYPTAMHPQPESLIFSWRFDYLVDDRKIDASGRIVDGERTIIPLTFTCSPLLVHPLQGKKVKLMHIVKKTVAAKLIAQKMEPPSIRPLQAAAAFGPLMTKSGQQGAIPKLNLHRRAHSHANHGHLDGASQSSISYASAPVQPKLENREIARHRVPHRRRVSSVGEWNQGHSDGMTIQRF